MVQNFDGPVVLAGQLAPRKINMFELRPKNIKLTGFGVTKSYQKYQNYHVRSFENYHV